MSSTTQVPALDGVLDTSPETVGRFAHDFGHLVTGAPAAVLRPGSAADVVTMVEHARSHGLRIAMNGQSGTGRDLESHSNYGQAAVPGGIAIDARGLSTIHRIDRTRAVVDAGVTWAGLFDAALVHGLTPPMLLDGFLDLSVGGTISVGGIGGATQTYGLLCDTVEEVDVVTGDGRLLTASATERPELFHAVLAGGGQCGIIVRATVRLVPAPDRVLVMHLFYDELPTYLADQERLLRESRADHLEGEVVAAADGTGWRYMIEIAAYYSAPARPDRAALLAGLRDVRAQAEITDHGYRDWAFRHAPLVTMLADSGYWTAPHPWLSLVLPASRTEGYVRSALPELSPTDLGEGFTGLYPFRTATLTCPMFVLPDPPEPVAYLFDLLPLPAPDDPGIPAWLDRNRSLYDRAVAVGGKRYLIGAIPDMTTNDWRRHFGPQWDMLVRAKQRFDPDNVLTPGHGIFP